MYASQPFITGSAMIVIILTTMLRLLEDWCTDGLPPGFWDSANPQDLHCLEHLPYRHDIFSITNNAMVSTPLNGHVKDCLEFSIQPHTWNAGLIFDL